jgi:hypothetical protein
MRDVSGRIEQLLAELGLLHDPDADQELEALKIAILLEDSLDVLLDDDDIDRLRVDGPSAVAGLVARHREPS